MDRLAERLPDRVADVEQHLVRRVEDVEIIPGVLRQRREAGARRLGLGDEQPAVFAAFAAAWVLPAL